MGTLAKTFQQGLKVMYDVVFAINKTVIQPSFPGTFLTCSCQESGGSNYLRFIESQLHKSLPFLTANSGESHLDNVGHSVMGN